MAAHWGQCVRCKWWAIEPNASRKPQTIGVCVDEELQEYKFRVNGAGGCARYQEGEPRRREYASVSPPPHEVVTGTA